MLLDILILQIVVRSPYYSTIFFFATLIGQDILVHQKVNPAKLVLRNIIVSTDGGSMFVTLDIETSKDLIIGSLATLPI